MGLCDPKAIRAGTPWYKAVRDFKAPPMNHPVLLGAKGRPVTLRHNPDGEPRYWPQYKIFDKVGLGHSLFHDMLTTVHSIHRMNAPYAVGYAFNARADEQEIANGEFVGRGDDLSQYDYYIDFKTRTIVRLTKDEQPNPHRQNPSAVGYKCPKCGRKTWNVKLFPGRVCNHCKLLFTPERPGGIPTPIGRNPTSEGKMTIGERLRALQFHAKDEVLEKMDPSTLAFIAGRPFAFLATVGAVDERRGHKICIAVMGEPGYVSTTGSFGTFRYDEAQQKADMLNKQMGVSEYDAFKIVASSMRKKNPYGTSEDRREYEEYIRSRGQRQGEPQTKPMLKPVQRPVKVGVKGEDNPKGGSELFESFHGNQPSKTRTVRFELPEPPLTKLGRLDEINYTVESDSQHHGTHFQHKAGDIGSKMLRSNTIVVADKKGNLFLVKENSKSPWPRITGRGILG